MDLKKLAHELVLSKRHLLFYLRDGQGSPKKDGTPGLGKPIGLGLIYKEGDKTYIGWSKCSPSDEFNRYKGILAAYSKKRATPVGEEVNPEFTNIPHDLIPLLNNMVDVLDRKVENGQWKLS
jgi:hypothetical protein